MSGTAEYVNRWAFKNGSSPTFDGTSDIWDFNAGSDIVKNQPILNAQGLAGTRVEDVSRTRLGVYTVSGTLTRAPGPAFFGVWLPRVMGGGTATSPALANALVEFGVLADRGGDIYKYLGCVVNRMTVSGRAGGLIDCALEIMGKSETAGQSWPGTVPAISSVSNSIAYEPFQHADLALTLASGARTVLDFRLVFENNVRAREANALTADAMIAGRRNITLEATVPFTSTEASALYSLSKDGAAGSLVLTNSTVSTTFTLSRVQIPDNSPRTQNGEIVLPIRAQIRGVSFADEMSATVDSTP